MPAVVRVLLAIALVTPLGGLLSDPPSGVSIAEIDPDQAGTDRWEFVELAGPPGTLLEGFRLVFFSAGSPGYRAYRVVRLDGRAIGPRGRFVVGSALVDRVDLVAWESNGIQNGGGAPDAVALYRDDAAPRAPIPTSLVDVVVYGDRDDPAFRARFRPTDPPPLLPVDGATASLGRGWDGRWRGDWPPSPGFVNGPARLNEVGAGGEIEMLGTRGASLAGLALAVYDGDGTLLANRPVTGTLATSGPLPGGRVLSADPLVVPPEGGSRLIALIRADGEPLLRPSVVLDAFVIGAEDGRAHRALGIAPLPPPRESQTIGRWAAGVGGGAAIGPTAPTLGAPNLPPAVPDLTISAVRGPVVAPDGCGRPPRWVARTVRLVGTATALIRESSGVVALLQDGDDQYASSAIVLAGLPDGTVGVGDRLTVTGVVGQRGGAVVLDEVAIEQRETGWPLPAPRELPPVLSPCVWAQLEGMRVVVPAGAIASAPRVLLASGESFVDVTLGAAQSDAPAGQRVFGSQVPGGLPPERLVRLTSQALRAQSSGAVLPPMHALDRLGAPALGVVTRLAGRPVIALEAVPSVEAGPRPTVSPPPHEATLRLATANLRNFFDRWDDPNDPNDNPGAPYVPATFAAYRDRLIATADLILGSLGAPDVIVLQEIEDQDLCRDGGQAFGRCGVEDNADGLLDVLHDLSIAVSRQSHGAVVYQPAADRRGVDGRGIVTALLFRPDRLTPQPLAETGRPDVAPPLAPNPLADPVVAADGEGERLFARPPVVMPFVTPAGERLVVIGVHFKSDSSTFRPRRAAQAAFVVEVARRELDADPTALVAVLGDINAPLAALTVFQSALPGGALVAALEQVPAAERYTFLFDGIAEAFDHVLLTPRLAARLIDVRVVHLNADRPDPAPHEDVVSPRLSDHDPVVVSFGATARFGSFIPLALR